jgi:FG-GAP-like repeat
LNGDGKVDVIVTNNFDPSRAYVLLNDGSGHFTRESAARLPTVIRGGNYYSVELVDINEDGRPDLVMGGHEFESAATSVFINPGTNNFAAVTPSIVPSVSAEGVVLDFTVTGTGSTRALWVLRTSGGDGTFYQSKVIQKVTWPRLDSSVVLRNRPAQWIPWLVPAIVNGVAVIASDDLADATSVPQQ